MKDQLSYDQTAELHESNYGTVKVKKGGKVVFTNSNVYLREIKVERSATVNFTQCANVYINKKWMSIAILSLVVQGFKIYRLGY